MARLALRELCGYRAGDTLCHLLDGIYHRDPWRGTGGQDFSESCSRYSSADNGNNRVPRVGQLTHASSLMPAHSGRLPWAGRTARSIHPVAGERHLCRADAARQQRCQLMQGPRWLDEAFSPWGYTESNCGPHPYQGCALTD